MNIPKVISTAFGGDLPIKAYYAKSSNCFNCSLYDESSLNKRLTTLATASANLTGTAFPICLYCELIGPVNL